MALVPAATHGVLVRARLVDSRPRGTFGVGCSVAHVTVRADSRHAWLPIVRWLVGGLFLGSVLSALFALDGLGWEALGILAFVPAALLPVGAFHALWWALGPARVTYQVADEEVQCRRGRRVGWGRPGCGIVEIHKSAPRRGAQQVLGPWLGWGDVLPTAWVVMDTGDRWSPENGEHGLPAILIWGESRLQKVERDLGSALLSCRADTGR